MPTPPELQQQLAPPPPPKPVCVITGALRCASHAPGCQPGASLVAGSCRGRPPHKQGSMPPPLAGLPARYRDPKTKLPYATLEAYRTLQQQYHPQQGQHAQQQYLPQQVQQQYLQQQQYIPQQAQQLQQQQYSPQGGPPLATASAWPLPQQQACPAP